MRTLISTVIAMIVAAGCVAFDGTNDHRSAVFGQGVAGPFADISTGFETNTAEGWSARIGSENVAVTSVDKHSGTYSLLTSNRLNAYDGCKINVSTTMTAGSRYRITVWTKLAPGASSTNLRVSLQRTVAGNNTYYTAVPNTAVTAAQWVKLTTLYDYSLAHDQLSLYLESESGTASFYIDDFQLELIPPPQIQNDIPSIYQTLEPYFKVGAAAGQGTVEPGAHSQLLAKHFNSVTSENDMKWGPIHPAESTYNYAPADALVNFAAARGMQVRGHPLVWHEQNPDWLFRDANGNPMTPTPANKALLLQRLDTHIRAVMTHFGNNIQSWDVVNEVIDQSQPDGLRRSPWFQICGTEFIDKAFQVAREVSPTAKLYINDFSTTDPAKRAFLLSLVQNLKSRGIPVDGVGHQMHSNIETPTATEIIDTINLFSAIPGIDNQITELDVSVYTNGTQMYDEIPNDILLKQGYQYREFFRAFRQLQGKISSVTFWGQADDNTWLSTFPIARLEAPLPFDTLLQAKPAYWGIVAPAVQVSGRVTTPGGLGLRNAIVTITDSQGVSRTATTSSFGLYSFDNVGRYETHTIRVSSKRYRFSVQIVQVNNAQTVVDFVGLE